MDSTRQLLAEYARLMNDFGVNSRQAEDFFAAHSGNEDFMDLAALSKRLKQAITPGSAEEDTDLVDTTLVDDNLGTLEADKESSPKLI